MCGTITKLVIFNKQGKEQALVQFERAEDAAVAMERFQGKNIYSGCNTLSIQYSNLPDITVKYNNDRSYDFTNPSLPAGEGLGGDALLSGAPSPERRILNESESHPRSLVNAHLRTILHLVGSKRKWARQPSTQRKPMLVSIPHRTQ